jgi:hypothetical protein
MAEEKNDYRELSKMDWVNKWGSTEKEDINTGSLQRAADALEKIAKAIEPTLKDYEMLKAMNARLEAKVRSLEYVKRCYEKRIAGLRGAITKLKKKIPYGK